MDAEDNSHSSKRAHFKFYCSGSPRARGGDCSGPLLTCEMVWFRCKPSHPRAMPSPFLLFRPIFHFDRDNPSCHSKCHFYILGFKTGYLNWCGWKIILEGGGGGSCLLPFNCFISLFCYTTHTKGYETATCPHLIPWALGWNKWHVFKSMENIG